MAKFLAALVTVALVALLGHVSCQDSTTMKPCSPSAFVRLDECCNMPVLVKEDTYKFCLEKVGARTNKTKNGGLSHVYKSYNGTRGGPGGPMCLIKCLLEKQGLLSSDGEANQDKIKSVLLAASSDQWKPIVTSAITECSSQLAKVKTPMTSTSVDGKICKAGPALFNTCVRRFLAINCVSKVESKATNCAKKLENAQKCDPWAMRNGEFPMLRAYRLKNTNANAKPKAAAHKKAKSAAKTG